MKISNPLQFIAKYNEFTKKPDWGGHRMATPIALFSKGRGDFFEIFGSHMGAGETGYAFIVLQPGFPVYDTHPRI